MIYTEEDYYDDLHSGKMLHLKSKERFLAFYERLGMDDIQKQQQVVNSRLDVLEKVKGTVIELGCHVGFQSIYLAELGHKVTGVDISSSLIHEEKIKKNKLPGEILNKLIIY